MSSKSSVLDKKFITILDYPLKHINFLIRHYILPRVLCEIVRDYLKDLEIIVTNEVERLSWGKRKHKPSWRGVYTEGKTIIGDKIQIFFTNKACKMFYHNHLDNYINSTNYADCDGRDNFINPTNPTNPTDFHKELKNRILLSTKATVEKYNNCEITCSSVCKFVDELRQFKKYNLNIIKRRNDKDFKDFKNNAECLFYDSYNVEEHINYVCRKIKIINHSAAINYLPVIDCSPIVDCSPSVDYCEYWENEENIATLYRLFIMRFIWNKYKIGAGVDNDYNDESERISLFWRSSEYGNSADNYFLLYDIDAIVRELDIVIDNYNKLLD